MKPLPQLSRLRRLCLRKVEGVRRGKDSGALQPQHKQQQQLIKQTPANFATSRRDGCASFHLAMQKFGTQQSVSFSSMASCAMEEETANISSVCLQDGTLLFDSHPILSSIPKAVYATHQQDLTTDDDMTATAAPSVILGASTSKNSSTHDIPIGNLICRRALALGRTSLWWMQPTWTGADDNLSVFPETQMMLLELEEGGPYAAMLPLVDPSGFRATLHGGPNVSKGWVALRIESGDKQTEAASWSSLLAVAASDNPYTAISAVVEAASQQLKTFRTLRHKKLPPWLDAFGWCTWDAFYFTVCAQDLPAGLRSLAEGGTPAKFAILDDGWQTVQTDPQLSKQRVEKAAEKTKDITTSTSWWATGLKVLNIPTYASNLAQNVVAKTVQWYYNNIVKPAQHTSRENCPLVKAWTYLAKTALRQAVLAFYAETQTFSKRLVSVRANTKFAGVGAGRDSGESTPEAGGGLKAVIKHAKDTMGVDWVIAWHALSAYWGGVSPQAEETNRYGATLQKPNNLPAMVEYEPLLDWDPRAIGGVGIVPPQSIGHVYDDMHTYLSDAGIDGVMVDVQAGVGPMGSGYGGGPSLVKTYTKELESSVKKHFPEGSVMGCMCHSTENLLHYWDTPVARASDDFYPLVEASHRAHIVGVSFNSLFIGEIAQPDWDMFHSQHPAAGLHAAARAISGGAVYVSDGPGHHDFELLKTLVLPNGRVLRALLPGRPTRDCLFENVSHDGRTALKVWNHNRTSGVLAAFNVQGASWDRSKRAFSTHDSAPATLNVKLSPSDVEDLCSFHPAAAYALHTHTTDEVHLLRADDRVHIELPPLGYEMASVTPVLFKDSVAFAAIGLADMLNCGGSVLQQTLSLGHRVSATVNARGCGRFLCYSSVEPVGVTLNGGAADFNFYEATGRLELTIPASDVDEVAISILW
eukprot:jgi/Chlat1/3680/Chrsp24S00277